MHLELAHKYWEKHLKRGDVALDATCGNGKDTLKLAQLVGVEGSVIALDIQEEAIAKTRAHLKTHLSPERYKKIFLFLQSHAELPSLAYESPPQLIVYNLGYLPGGNKSRTTLTESTVESLKKSLSILPRDGMISLTCYPGHKEGAREQEVLLPLLYQLNSLEWKIEEHFPPEERPLSPSLHIIKKLI